VESGRVFTVSPLQHGSAFFILFSLDFLLLIQPHPTFSSLPLVSFIHPHSHAATSNSPYDQHAQLQLHPPFGLIGHLSITLSVHPPTNVQRTQPYDWHSIASASTPAPTSPALASNSATTATVASTSGHHPSPNSHCFDPQFLYHCFHQEVEGRGTEPREEA
jgi:hypothetical protein